MISTNNVIPSKKTPGGRPPLRFDHKNKADFYSTLRERVNAYFEEKDISRHANSKMYIKTLVILSVFVLTYGLLLSNIFANNPWILLGIALTHGFFTALIGLNISHDAVHGAYTSGTKWNKLIGTSFNLIGANDFMWKCSHNVMHHSHTNIVDYDADIDQIPLIRLNPHQELWWIHRFQHVYIFFIYSLTSLAWVFFRDYAEFFHSKVDGKNRTQTPVKEFARMVVYKIVYYSFFVILPFVVMDIPWQWFLIGFILMHLVEGLTLALIFQLAHVIEGTDFPLPDENNKLHTSWAAHQLYTTANFACNNDFLNYICGGLNFQVEHHLFPTVCHVHYKEISPIVSQTAKEYGLPYNEHKTYLGALASHIRQLKIFGKPTAS